MSEPRRRPLFTRRGLGIIAALLVVGVIIVLLVPQRRRGEPAWRIKCSANLRQIGLGIKVYYDAHGKATPPDFPTLLTNVELFPDVVVCPKSDAEPSKATTAAGLAADFAAPGRHVSYVYVGDGVDLDRAPDNAVLAYDLPANHDGEGVNVLFADGHVDWMYTRGPDKQPLAFWQAVERQTRDGVRPVLIEPTPPTTRAN